MNYKEYDEYFLNDLIHEHNREIWVRITLLDKDDNFLSALEGVATGGSVNIDGTSAVRRTCSITMTARDIGMAIDNFYWGLNAKFSVEVGLTAHKKENLKKYIEDYSSKYIYYIYDINSGVYIEAARTEEEFKNYRNRGITLYVKIDLAQKEKEIVWFEQGVFLCTGFTTTQNINSYTINLSGKDKMCQLNGELGGTFTADTVLSETDETEEVYIPIELDETSYEYNKYYVKTIDDNKLQVKVLNTNFMFTSANEKKYKKGKYFFKNVDGQYELLEKDKEHDNTTAYYQLIPDKFYYEETSYKKVNKNEEGEYGIKYNLVENVDQLFIPQPEVIKKNYKKGKYYYKNEGIWQLDKDAYTENRKYYSWAENIYIIEDEYSKISLSDFTLEVYEQIDLSKSDYKKNVYYYKGYDDNTYTKSIGSYVENRIYYKKIKIWDLEKVNKLLNNTDIYIKINKKYQSIEIPKNEGEEFKYDLSNKYYISKPKYVEVNEYEAEKIYYNINYSTNTLDKQYKKVIKNIEITNSNYEKYVTESNLNSGLIFYNKPEKEYFQYPPPEGYKGKIYYVKNKYQKISSLTEKKFQEQDYYIKNEFYEQINTKEENKIYYMKQCEKIKAKDNIEEVINNLLDGDKIWYYDSKNNEYKDFNPSQDQYNVDTQYYKFSYKYHKIPSNKAEEAFKNKTQEIYYYDKNKYLKINYDSNIYNSKTKYYIATYNYIKNQNDDDYPGNIAYYKKIINYTFAEEYEKNQTYYVLLSSDKWDYEILPEDDGNIEIDNRYYLKQENKAYNYVLDFEGFSKSKTYYERSLETLVKEVKIEDIIRNLVHIYANEPLKNIVINDLDTIAVEQLVYNNEEDNPLYMFYDFENSIVESMTLDGTQKVYYKENEGSELKAIAISDIESTGKTYDNLINQELLNNNIHNTALKVYKTRSDNNFVYTVIKINKGDVAGYRLTDLVYPGKLEVKAGETIVSALDKIKNEFSDFEYFYDIKGKFVFQKKKTYVNTSWNNLNYDSENDLYVKDSAYSSSYVFTFEDSDITTSFQNTPNLLNLKNDYSLWGQGKTASGAVVPIHYRYAIDKKPTYYKSIDFENPGNIYITGDKLVKDQKGQEYSIEEYDWREILYQMAADYFRYFNYLSDFNERVAEANKDKGLYQEGKTGYEIYYTDMQGYWRNIFKPINTQQSYKEKINPNNYKNNYSYNDFYFYAIKNENKKIIKYIKISEPITTCEANPSLKFGKKVPSNEIEEIVLTGEYKYSKIINATRLRVPTNSEFKGEDKDNWKNFYSAYGLKPGSLFKVNYEENTINEIKVPSSSVSKVNEGLAKGYFVLQNSNLENDKKYDYDLTIFDRQYQYLGKKTEAVGAYCYSHYVLVPLGSSYDENYYYYFIDKENNNLIYTTDDKNQNKGEKLIIEDKDGAKKVNKEKVKELLTYGKYIIFKKKIDIEFYPKEGEMITSPEKEYGVEIFNSSKDYLNQIEDENKFYYYNKFASCGLDVIVFSTTTEETSQTKDYYLLKEDEFIPFESVSELKRYCFDEKNYIIYKKKSSSPNNLMEIEEEIVTYQKPNTDFKCETETINYFSNNFSIKYEPIKIRSKDYIKAEWHKVESTHNYNPEAQYRSRYKVVEFNEEYSKDIEYIVIQILGDVGSGYGKPLPVDENNFKTYITQTQKYVVMKPIGTKYEYIWSEKVYKCLQLNGKSMEVYELVDPNEGIIIPDFEENTYYFKDGNVYMLIETETQFANVKACSYIYEIYKKTLTSTGSTRSVEQATSYYYVPNMNYYTSSKGKSWELVSPNEQYQFSNEAKKQEELYLLNDPEDAGFSPITGWNFNVTENPAVLPFWIDFMEVEGEMGKYQVSAIGDRIKSINDNKITAIYFNGVPNVIFTTEEEKETLDFKSKYQATSGYSFILINEDLMNCFSTSGRGKSAKEELDSQLYSHSYCAESINLTTLPVYHLQPNTRILVRNDETKINGEYIINRIILPLNYDGTSNISAVKAVERLY